LILRRASTAELSAGQLAEVRALMDAAFDDFTDDDWHHTIGGQHVLMEDESGALVAHGSVVERTLEVDGRPFRTGYVEGVAVAPARQRQGLGTLVMAEVAEIVRAGFELGGLGATFPAFYETLGWKRWQGPTYARDGIALDRTEEDDGWVMVLRFGPSAGADLAAPLSCETRPGDDW
jgi:aminoglycoside 2'-N-acetyltransferase I